VTAGFTALLFAVGVTTWIYAKFMRRTNHGRTSLIAAGVIGVIAFIVFFTLFKTFMKS